MVGFNTVSNIGWKVRRVVDRFESGCVSVAGYSIKAADILRSGVRVSGPKISLYSKGGRWAEKSIESFAFHIRPGRLSEKISRRLDRVSLFLESSEEHTLDSGGFNNLIKGTRAKLNALHFGREDFSLMVLGSFWTSIKEAQSPVWIEDGIEPGDIMRFISHLLKERGMFGSVCEVKIKGEVAFRDIFYANEKLLAQMNIRREDWRHERWYVLSLLKPSFLEEWFFKLISESLPAKDFIIETPTENGPKWEILRDDLFQEILRWKNQQN
ncbi:hypothetical protein A2230_01260 [candidate division WOR-1 bacterium RIFOXYA2_FULL_36_21]|uniref:Uncharacterized protein n=1 Tax=candidate division WOR-1 bacterium RIFOXYB2_FULL_36_35 TaxID=1802578 RepID=A0A1F4RYU2_UNCSA|nr:MAG: hypothetical protein A2230_01260 [candidate division WOR-1 bacterium RIFOXYA2_FULL_36_21]OGC13340.1 MAG: hypothetical protein A2290_04750 [candidate division WOR-1 bacterium RIFOXYB2_FULL_36_35]OGC21047.1 MAG: hypothetical protein A2282_08515 [candidate division WOR-1 bacterium RIFOXYA12_FULL_36_13]